MKKYKPDLYYQSIYTINYTFLQKKNIKNLLFDLDNTLVEAHKNIPSDDLKKQFDHLKKIGFRIFIFSNSPKKRLEPFGKILKVDVNAFSLKPLLYSFHKMSKKYHLKKEETAIIGDQLLTDIVGGNRFGIMTILVDPITTKDFFLTKFNRFREKQVMKKLEKKGLLKRGKYDK